MSSPSVSHRINAPPPYRIEPTLRDHNSLPAKSPFQDRDDLTVRSATSILLHTPHTPLHHTTQLTNSSSLSLLPTADELSQQKVCTRSLSVQPAMSPHSHFFTDDSQNSLSIIQETIPRPFLFQAKFGSPSNWALDIFTLPHNAVRAECVDLYDILESIQVRSHRVEFSELEEFYTWWTAFEAFVIEYFDFEADVLFSWIFPKLNDRTEDSPASDMRTNKINGDLLLETSLLAKKEPLLESFRQVNGTFELRRHVDSSDVFQTILEEVNDFVPKLMEYFHVEERHLPSLVSELHPATVKDTILKRYMTYIKHGEAPHMNMAILIRWMDKTTREKWVRANVRGFSRLLYSRWEKRCSKEHAHIPFKFHRRLLRSVRSVAASRLRRRTEFGEEIEDISFGSLASNTGSFRSISLTMGSKVSSTSKSRRSRETSRSKGKVR